MSDIPAIQESREDIDILKNQTGIRIKNYLFDLLKDIKKETNIQVWVLRSSEDEAFRSTKRRSSCNTTYCSVT